MVTSNENSSLIKCCHMCEAWCGDEHDYNGCKNCPALAMSEEIKMLNRKVARLKNEMSYMHNPLTIGDRHEMGG